MATRNAWRFVLVAAAAAILMVTMGTRQSMGLFLSPLHTHTGLGIANISFAMAIGQFVWGAVQPVFGAVADRWGPGRVIVFGALLLATGCALTTQVASRWGLIVAIGVLSAAGAGAGSYSIPIGATAQHIPAERRSFAGGVINAGGSLGQFIFAPLNQAVLSAFGWMQAMWMMAVVALTTAPMAWWLHGRPRPPVAAGSPATELTLRHQLKIAARDRSGWCLHTGFFTCGFHIAFLVTHMPGEVNLWVMGEQMGEQSSFPPAETWRPCGLQPGVQDPSRSSRQPPKQPTVRRSCVQARRYLKNIATTPSVSDGKNSSSSMRSTSLARNGHTPL